MSSSSSDRTVRSDFVFPALLPPAEREIVRLYRQLEVTQWWPAERLREWQLSQAARLLAQARAHVPFYAGLPGGAVDAEAWRALPILTKEQVRAESGRLRNPALPANVPTYSQWTTGSTGVPLETVKTAPYDFLFRAMKLRLYRWHGYEPAGKLCEIRRPYWKTEAMVHRFTHWEWPFGTLFHTPQGDTGEQVTMSIYSEPEAQLAFLEAEAPEYLTTLPSNLRLLLRAFRRAGKRLPSLRLVRTYTERVDPDLRQECQAVLGVPLVDVYGCEEGGFLAITCPGHEHYHVQSEMNLVEILREDGEPCQPGETGRVVITPLHAFAMPLLRYELGDYAEVGEPCPCGRGLPVLRRIYGRRRQLLTLPSGERRYSALMAPIFEGLRAVIQYQVVQKSLTLLEVRIAAERPLEKAECEQIVERFVQQVGAEFEIRLVFVESIPRLPGGKYMDFFSEIGND